ncbi:pyrimidine/purine nucleoside phosphorylase [Acinetobacter equi]|uniref:Uncharacterized protein n=1 Tax=Acinetobacter equi TaxID=1324350 RepID=A0A0N9W2T5_9GAMM|nr:pyrimidine/purine nucleoside phosphorylase [Acinetobacter equi]ALH96057.1 hypothetical protein AOY20_11225 [Acinetobacter equi]
MTKQFDEISIAKKSLVYFEGKSISRVIEFTDGSKKTIGVILATDYPLKFKTHVVELIEIISGRCEIWIGDDEQGKVLGIGDCLEVPANSYFKIKTDGILDYICHLMKE